MGKGGIGLLVLVFSVFEIGRGGKIKGGKEGWWEVGGGGEGGQPTVTLIVPPYKFVDQVTPTDL